LEFVWILGFGAWLFRRGSRRGILLVEAVLCAVVIAVGLTFITRSLSNQLKALHTLEEYATLTQLAQTVFLELERDVQASQAPQRAPTGAFDQPYSAYQWTLTAQTVTEEGAAVPLSLVRLSVNRADVTAFTVVLQAIWPSDLVPPEWL